MDKHGSHITWDEEVIAEHDKERGTRQKIDEPPTPYHYEDKEEPGFEPSALAEADADPVFSAASPRTHSVEGNWEALSAKLAYEETQQHAPRGDAMDVDEEADAESEEKKRHEAFQKKRESHYNEFKVLQALRNKMAMEDDEDDEDA